MDGDNLQTGLSGPALDVLNVVVQIDGQQLHRGEAQTGDGLEFLFQRGAKAQVAGDAAKGIGADTEFHVAALLNDVMCMHGANHL